jgi:heparin/heparan-sulfate lyase
LKSLRLGRRNSLSAGLKTVTPESFSEADVTKIGGPGKDCWVFGENFPNAATTRPDPCNERGAWRVEVTPKKDAKEDCFLNVMQVMDNTVAPLQVQKIDGDKVV